MFLMVSSIVNPFQKVFNLFCLNPSVESYIWQLPHAKSWLIGKDSDAGRDWGQEEKGTTEDEMAGWHHGLDGREFEWTPGAGDGQGGLVCCNSWDHKESDMTERLNWTELNWKMYSTRLTQHTVPLAKYSKQKECHCIHLLIYCLLWWVLGFSRWLSGKESTSNAEGTGDTGLIPGSGRSPGGGCGNPLQYSCLENPMDRGAWWDIQFLGSQRLRHDSDWAQWQA